MRNRVIAVISVAISMILFAGCTSGGSYTTLLSTENNTPTTMTMNYKQFNGTKFKTIQLSEGETCDITADIISDSGKLDLSVTDKDGGSYFQGTELPTSIFTVKLDKAGEYKITIQAENHSGSYKIAWDIKK